MAYSCCIITTTAEKNTWPHLVDNQNIIFAKSANDMVAKIIDMYYDRDKIKKLGKNARTTFENNYSAKKVVKEYEELMEKVIIKNG